jgi:hypothetical protein
MPITAPPTANAAMRTTTHTGPSSRGSTLSLIPGLSSTDGLPGARGFGSAFAPSNRRHGQSSRREECEDKRAGLWDRRQPQSDEGTDVICGVEVIKIKSQLSAWRKMRAQIGYWVVSVLLGWARLTIKLHHAVAPRRNPRNRDIRFRK